MYLHEIIYYKKMRNNLKAVNYYDAFVEENHALVSDIRS